MKMKLEILHFDFKNARADVSCFKNGSEVNEYHAMVHVASPLLNYNEQVEAVVNAYGCWGSCPGHRQYLSATS